MERVLNVRLMWFLEQKKQFLSYQYGFRKSRGTIDVLVLLEHEINMALRSQKIVLVVSFDLSAAFDRASHLGILYKLAVAGVEGRALRWIAAFLKNRTFRVSLASCTSEPHGILSGVPQGAILSPLLFNVLMSDMPNNPNVTTSIYADDITMYVTGDTVQEVTTKLQTAINSFSDWTKNWGLKLNPHKSAISYFTNKRSLASCPVLTLDNVPLPYDSKLKLLGVIFDSPHLTWKHHIEQLRLKCMKRINIMKFLAGSKHGCSRYILSNFYTAYIRSLTDYSLPLYSAASACHLDRLDVVHSTAARLITGAWLCTPLLPLYCEAGLLPPVHHRQLKSAHAALQLLSRSEDHPIHKVYQQDNFLRIIPFRTKHNRTPLLYRVCHDSRFLDITLPPSSPASPFSVLPPWYPLHKIIHTSFSSLKVKELEGAAVQIYSELKQSKFCNFEYVYTDGSASADPERRVGAGLVVPLRQHTGRWRLQPEHTVLAAELFAILQALEYIHGLDSGEKTVVFTDSLSSLQLLTSFKLNSYSFLVNKIHNLLQSFPVGSVQLQFIPGHSSIPGNDAADVAAKEAAGSNGPFAELPLSISEHKNQYSHKVWQYWQTRWSAGAGQHHLGSIKRSVRPWGGDPPQTRRFEVLFAQMRLGLPPLNRALFRINRAESPNCPHCQARETVHHFLIACPYYSQHRRILFQRLRGHFAAVPTLALLLASPPGLHTSEIAHAVQDYIVSSRRFD